MEPRKPANLVTLVPCKKLCHFTFSVAVTALAGGQAQQAAGCSCQGGSRAQGDAHALLHQPPAAAVLAGTAHGGPHTAQVSAHDLLR
jgi:hypothetical protein